MCVCLCCQVKPLVQCSRETKRETMRSRNAGRFFFFLLLVNFRYLTDYLETVGCWSFFFILRCRDDFPQWRFFFCTYLKQCFSEIPLPSWKLSIKLLFFSLLMLLDRSANVAMGRPCLLLSYSPSPVVWMFVLLLYLLFFFSFSSLTYFSPSVLLLQHSFSAFFLFLLLNLVLLSPSPSSYLMDQIHWGTFMCFSGRYFYLNPKVCVCVCGGWKRETLLASSVSS